MAVILIYFTHSDVKRVLIGDRVYENGVEIFTSPLNLELLSKRKYISPWVKYYSDASYAVENKPLSEDCNCTPYHLLHGNPNCPDHN